MKWRQIIILYILIYNYIIEFGKPSRTHIKNIYLFKGKNKNQILAIDAIDLTVNKGSSVTSFASFTNSGKLGWPSTSLASNLNKVIL